MGMVLALANFIGAITYLYAASASWAIPEERAQGIHSVTGEPFVWFVRAVPIFAGFSLLNLSWGAYICTKRRWRVGYTWLSTFALWLIAVWIDFARH
jgi:hypothetical protein